MDLLTATSDEALVEVALRNNVAVPQQYYHLLPSPILRSPLAEETPDEASYEERQPRRILTAL